MHDMITYYLDNCPEPSGSLLLSLFQTIGVSWLPVLAVLPIFDEPTSFLLSATSAPIGVALAIEAAGAVDECDNEDVAILPLSSAVAFCLTNGNRFIVMDGCDGNVGELGLSLAGDISGELSGGEIRPESTAIVIKRWSSDRWAAPEPARIPWLADDRRRRSGPKPCRWWWWWWCLWHTTNR